MHLTLHLFVPPNLSDYCETAESSRSARSSGTVRPVCIFYFHKTTADWSCGNTLFILFLNVHSVTIVLYIYIYISDLIRYIFIICINHRNRILFKSFVIILRSMDGLTDVSGKLER